MNNDRWRKYALRSMEGFVDVAFPAKTLVPFIWGEHHRLICRALDRVVRCETKRLMINIAPRYSKTELVSKLFVAYGLARNPQSRFLLLSYSDDLVLDNSRDISNFVRSPGYQEIAPLTKIEGMGFRKWETTLGGGVYAVSAAGQVTGFGAGRTDTDEFAGAIILDDPLKPDDANSDIEREKVNQRFETTIRSRANSRNTPIIIVGQRLHEHDLFGYLLDKEPGEWEVLCLPCITEKGKALWPFKHTLEDLERLRRADALTFETQYLQNPTPREGLMYAEFRTWDALPVGAGSVENYTDTADTGADFLCSICYAKYDTAVYVLDVLYTQKPMEYTEPETARMLTRNGVRRCVVESNNGGRGFRRNVEAACRKLGNVDTAFEDLTQRANKASRIFTASARVTNLVYMPAGWERRWPEFAQDVRRFRKEGRNAHDDAPDVLTGIVEQFEGSTGQYAFGYGGDYEY
jgi:predicted phage terminase large subunit-like protein